jgi:hypothetical protein
MDDLCAHAYELCKDSISVESIDEWLDFLQMLPSPPSASGSGAVSPAGVTTPSLPLPPNLHELHHVQFGVGPPPTNGVSPLSPPIQLMRVSTPVIQVVLDAVLFAIEG